MQNPILLKCSVIIPTRDRNALLLRAVRSALAALPQNSEVIVVDDGSTVPAFEVLTGINDDRLSVLRSECPMAYGGSPARNFGVKNARGQILFFLDDDDELIPDYISHVLASAVSQGADFGFAARKILKNGRNGRQRFKVENRRLCEGFIVNSSCFKRRAFPFSAGFWIKREAYDAIGPISEMLVTNSDTDYCCRLYSSSLQGWYSPRPAVIIYEDEAGSSGQLGHLTKRANAANRAYAFKQIATSNDLLMRLDPSATLFVYARWIKHGIRSDRVAEVQAVLAEVPHFKARLSLLFYALFLSAPFRNARKK